MWGGWYKDNDYMKFMETSRNIYKASMEKYRSSAAEIAVFIDEKSYALFQSNEATAPSNAKKVLGLTATPYDIYLAEDFNAVYEKYKAVVFIVPTETELSASNIETAKKHNLPYLLYTPQTTRMKPEELMEFFTASDVHVYADSPCVVYASKSHLFLHTADEGEYNFTADENKTFIDVFTQKAYTFPCRLKAGQSLLFER